MSSFFRSLLVVVTLLSSGVLQLTVAVGEDPCCGEEKGGPCPDCPLGIACSCCPFRGAVHVAAPELVPVASPIATVVIASAELSPRTSVADIFHPPRA